MNFLFFFSLSWTAAECGCSVEIIYRSPTLGMSSPESNHATVSFVTHVEAGSSAAIEKIT